LKELPDTPFYRVLMTRIGAVINSKSGILTPEETEKRLKEVKQELEKRTSPDLISIVPGDRIESEIQRIMKSEPEILIIGGGDGTCSTAARHVAGSNTALAVLALGTRNHFARDLGIPLDVEEALTLLDRMKRESIDLGEVNGVSYINNATIGLYPLLVEIREERMEKMSISKWPAHISAAMTVLRRFPQMRLTIQDRDSRTAYLTPFLFVGNNEYESRMITEARRDSLKDGKLWYCLARSGNVQTLLRSAWQLQVGGIQSADHFQAWLTEEMTVYTRSRSRVKVAIDGEVHQLRPPLGFKTRKQILQVLVA